MRGLWPRCLLAAKPGMECGLATQACSYQLSLYAEAMQMRTASLCTNTGRHSAQVRAGRPQEEHLHAHTSTSLHAHAHVHTLVHTRSTLAALQMGLLPAGAAAAPMAASGQLTAVNSQGIPLAMPLTAAGLQAAQPTAAAAAAAANAASAAPLMDAQLAMQLGAQIPSESLFMFGIVSVPCLVCVGAT